MIRETIKKYKEILQEPLWVALIAVGILGLGVTLGIIISGVTGIIVALLPFAIFLLILCLINPYPFWLVYFALIPFSYLVKGLLPMDSFVRFGGLILVALSIPYIMLSKESDKFKITPTGASILLFCVGCVLSLLSFFEMESALMGVGLFIGNAMAYWVFVNILGKEKQVYQVINLFIVILCIESIIAITQKAYATNPLIRAEGTISDPNYFSFWLIPFLCFSFYLGVAARKWGLKLFYFGAYLLMTVTIPLTYSRSMIIVLIVVQFILYWRQKKILLFLGLCAALVGIFYLSFPTLFAETGLSIQGFFQGARAASITWRSYFAKTAIRIFYDHPLFGIGADCFPQMFNFYTEIAPKIVHYSVHNSWLEILSGTGLVGTLPFLGIIFFSLASFWKTRKYYSERRDRVRVLKTEGLMVGFIGSLMAHLFLTAQHHITLWLFIAISTVLANLTFQNDQNASLRSSQS